MYSQDDMNLREAYGQINEIFGVSFGKQHLKKIPYKILSLISVTAEEKLRQIRYANAWINKMKRDAVRDNKNFYKLDKDWIEAWMVDKFGFNPSDLGVEYTPDTNKSDYIRYALGAASEEKRIARARELGKSLPSKPTQSTSEVKNISSETKSSEPTPSSESDEGPELTYDIDLFDEKEAPETPKNEIEKNRSEISDAEARLKEIRKEREELEAKK